MSFNQEMMINDDILRISRISSASSFIWWFQAPKHQCGSAFPAGSPGEGDQLLLGSKTHLGVSIIMGDPQNGWFVMGTPNLKWTVFRGTSQKKPPFSEQVSYVCFTHGRHVNLRWLGFS